MEINIDMGFIWAYRIPRDAYISFLYRLLSNVIFKETDNWAFHN